MIVADLEPADLDRALLFAGLRLRTGPVVNNIRTPLRAVREGIAQHYAQHTVEPNDGFADFHVSVEPGRGLRRWVDRQVVFRFDGTQPSAPLPGNLGFAMLEWGLDWCISNHCHHYLIVHAAVLERGGRAVLLPAPPGAGKSTLSAGLVLGGGWRLLSDKLALIEPATSRVVPLPRPVSLKNQSIDAIRTFAPSAAIGAEVHESTTGRVAYMRPSAESVLKEQQSALPAWVVVPSCEAGAPTQLRPLSRASAFMSLVDNAINYELHGRSGFAAIANVIDRCECHGFTYSDLPEAVAAFNGLALSDR